MTDLVLPTPEENRKPLRHGTYSGYVYYGCRCGDCTAANRAWARRYHAKRKAKVPPAGFEPASVRL